MAHKFTGISIFDYHANDAVSSTKLATFHDSPLRYYEQHVLKTLAPKESWEFDFGQAFHSAMESDAALAAAVVPMAFRDFRTDKAKEWREEMTKARKLILTDDEMGAINLMKAKCLAHPIVSELIKNSEPEVTWRRSFGKFTVQCRTDRWKEDHEGRPLIVDWKTCVNLAAFKKNVANFGYHRSTCFYKEVVASCMNLSPDQPRPRMIHVAVESEPPHEVQPYELDDDALNVGRAEIMSDLKSLRRCYETGDWGRPAVIESIGLPYFYVKQAEKRLLMENQRLELP